MKTKLLVRPLVSAVYSVLELANDKLFNFMQRMGLVLNVAHVGAASYTGNIYSISATLPATYDAAGYGASPFAWTVIGEVSDFPPYGAKAAKGSFTPINGAIEKFKGTADYGSGNIVCADVPADAGQVLLKAASISSAHYSIKVLSPDGEKDYLDVILTGWEIAAAKENTAKTRTGGIEVCKAVVTVAA